MASLKYESLMLLIESFYDYFLMQWFLLGSCFIFYMEHQVETQNHDQIK